MSRSLVSRLEYTAAEELAALATAKEAAIRERAFELGRTRTTARDEIRDWLDAERSLYRRPNLRLSLAGSLYRFEIELPGVRAEEITVRLGGDRMIVEATRGEPSSTPLVDELGASHWWREQRLPTDARAEKAEITLSDGILTLSLRRAEPMPIVTEAAEQPAAERSLEIPAVVAKEAPKPPTRGTSPAKEAPAKEAPRADGRTPKPAAKAPKKATKPKSRSNDAG